MGTTAQADALAVEKTILEEQQRAEAAISAQTQVLAARTVHTATLLRVLSVNATPTAAAGTHATPGVEHAVNAQLSAPQITAEEFSKNLNDIRLHYAAPATTFQLTAFRLPVALARPVVAGPVKPTAAAAARPVVMLTKAGTEATGSLLAQGHAEILKAIQVHTAGSFDALKTYQRSKDLTAFQRQMEALGAALKAHVNAAIDRAINDALRIGQQHAEQHSALVAVVNTIGHALGSAAHAVASAANTVAHGIASAAKDVGHAVTKAAQDIGHAAASAVSSVGHFFGL